MQILGKRVVYLPFEERYSKSGLDLSQANSLRTGQGIVCFVGDEITSLKAGDKIIVGEYASNPFKYEDQHYMIVDEQHILCKVEEDDE